MAGAAGAADDSGDIDQAEIDALMAGAAAPAAPQSFASDGPLDQAELDALLQQGTTGGGAAAGGTLDQSTIDRMLGTEDTGGDLDQATIDALLRPDDDADEGLMGGGGLLDQATLDALWAQAESEANANMAEAESRVMGPAPTSAPKPPPTPTISMPAAAPAAAPAGRPKVTQSTVGDLDLLSDVVLTVTAEIGRTDVTIEEILKLGPGYLIELDKVAGEPVELFVNDRCIARGEVVVVEDHFAVRITELGH